MEIIKTDLAPQAIGPYSQAIKVNGFVYLSGQIGLEPKSMQLVDGLENQTYQICENIINILEKAGLKISNVVKTTIFLKNINDFEVVNKLYGKFFTHKPARSTIEISNLPKNALIEIECVAYK